MQTEELTPAPQGPPQSPGNGGVKADDGKEQWHLMPWDALDYVLAVLQDGANSEPGRAEFGWLHVPEGRKRYLNALQRHSRALFKGHAEDHKSGLPVEAHVAANALILLARRLAGVDADTKVQP